MKAFIFGTRETGWSLDADYQNTKSLLHEAGIEISTSPFSADVWHFVWWNQLTRFIWRVLLKFMPRKKNTCCCNQ